MKDKIEKLLEIIKKDFPKGCDDFKCEDCLLEEHKEDETIESAVCDMLSVIEYRSKV